METIIIPAGSPAESFATTHRTTHVPTPAGFIRIGIQSRVEISLLNQGAITSPFHAPAPREFNLTARK